VAQGGSNAAARGGAIYSDSGEVTLLNTTLSANRADSAAGGGSSFGAGIYSLNGSTSIFNSTITDGTSTSGRGVYVLADGGTASVTMRNSIVGQDQLPESGFDLFISYEPNGILQVSGANNLVRSQNDFQDLSLVPGNDPEPQLAALSNNGGPTWTHAILGTIPNHPALDQGDPSFDPNDPDGDPLTSAVAIYDQRGVPFSRVLDGDGVGGPRVDIGAAEFVPGSPAPELPGDYNGDHKVNAADYTVWRNTRGLNVPRYSGADGDGSTWIDLGDYQTWKTNYGMETQPPEGAGTDRGASNAPAVQAPAASAKAEVPASATIDRAEPPRPDMAPGAVGGRNLPFVPSLVRSKTHADQPPGLATPFGRINESLLLLRAGDGRQVITRADTAFDPSFLGKTASGLANVAALRHSPSDKALPIAGWDQLWSDWSAGAPRRRW
jgi:hypothetical protein